MRFVSRMVVVVGLTFLGGCGESFSKPEEVVRVFLDRMSAGDIGGARACLARHEQAVAKLRAPAGSVQYEIGSAQQKGDHAKVPITVIEGAKRTESHWMAVREGGSWRISITMTVAQGKFEKLKQEMDGLDEGATDEERVEALRRAMRNAAPGK